MIARAANEDDAQNGCYFCQKAFSSDRTREHAVPQWLLRYLNVASEPIRQTHVAVFGSEISSRQLRAKNVVLGGVCESCNGGWLSQLESQAMPLIKDLINGKALTIGQKEMNLIRAWGYKTAMVFNSSSNYRQLFTVEDFAKFFETRQSPSNVSIDLALLSNASSNEYRTRQSSVQMFLAPSEVVREKITPEVAERSGVITFQFGPLLLQTLSPPGPEWERVSERSSEILTVSSSVDELIWPPERYRGTIDTLNVSPSLRWVGIHDQ